jgi:hypothetical protein
LILQKFTKVGKKLPQERKEERQEGNRKNTIKVLIGFYRKLVCYYMENV